jgi:hypothetical protein
LVKREKEGERLCIHDKVEKARGCSFRE